MFNLFEKIGNYFWDNPIHINMSVGHKGKAAKEIDSAETLKLYVRWKLPIRKLVRLSKRQVTQLTPSIFKFKYVVVQLDRSVSFGKHLQIATTKTIECAANLTRRMPNIGGSRKAKRKLMGSVVHLKLLYEMYPKIMRLAFISSRQIILCISFQLKMTERTDQRICIKFCFYLGKSCTETIEMI